MRRISCSTAIEAHRICDPFGAGGPMRLEGMGWKRDLVGRETSLAVLPDLAVSN